MYISGCTRAVQAKKPSDTCSTTLVINLVFSLIAYCTTCVPCNRWATSGAICNYVVKMVVLTLGQYEPPLIDKI